MIPRRSPAVLALAAVLAAAPAGRAQYAPYQQRLFEESQRRAERQTSHYLAEAYAPNFTSSVSTEPLQNYLNQLRARAEEERRQRAEARARNAELMVEMARRLAAEREAAELRAQLDQWEDAKRRGRAGDASASYAVARTLLRGDSRLPSDEATGEAGALPWMRQAARQGSARAAYHLGVLLARPAPAGRAPREALDAFARAVELGDLDAIPAAANLAWTGGDGFGPDPDLAWRLCQPGVAAGHPRALRAAAALLLDRPGASRDDIVRAAGWLEQLAPSDPVAAGRLAFVLFDGRSGVPQDRDRAVALARRAREAVPEFHALDLLLARAALNGDGGEPRDGARAVELAARAAGNGVARAAEELGFWYSVGFGPIPKSRPDANRWLEAAARMGVRSAAVDLGHWYGSGPGNDPARAAEFFRMAADAGDGRSAVILARRWMDGLDGWPRRPEEARRMALRAAELAEASGMLLAARMCEAGIGGPSDPAAARHWLRHAAATGHAEALRDYGLALLQGRLFGRDPAAGVEAMRAAAQVDGEAMYLLSLLHVEGRSCEPDLAVARDWARRSAGAGNPAGQRLYGQFLRHGRGGAGDGPGAVEWLGRAAEVDDPRALLELGEIFRDGLPGVPPDRGRARGFLERAAAGSDAGVSGDARRQLAALDAPGDRVDLSGLRIGGPASPPPARVPTLFEQLSIGGPPPPAGSRTKLDSLKIE